MSDAPRRVVSLLPSASETIALLGAADRLVGRSHECDFPAALASVPVLTASRLDDPGTSIGVDRGVRALVRDALAIYTVDVERLEASAPDLVVTQDLCAVCAVSLDDVRSAVQRLSTAGEVEILSLTPTRLGHVFDDIERIAAALAIPATGARIRAELTARMNAVEKRAQEAGQRPRVASVEWLDPIMLGGTWMPELIAMAGGRPVGATAGEHAPTLTLDELRLLEPEVVVIKPCGFSIARSLGEKATLKRIAAAMPAGCRVVLTDGNAYFNRPGPRLVESLEILAACIHPGHFPELARRHAGELVPIDRS
ncbi:ABC transporter substrate-binding protein [Gaopeijia maritima]|uniref:ABC transporter substrate-binding protein n=1 Tax=Gaopeijia maritima TaxID=3119007 RepID=UPI00324EC1E2